MSDRADTPHVALLSRIPIFDCFSRQELEVLAGLVREELYRRGEVVCTEGEPGETFFVIASGELEVWSGEPRRVVRRLGPGEFAGEITLLTDLPRTATITAARAAKLLVLNRPDFDRYFAGNAKVLSHLAQVLSRRLASTSRSQGAPTPTLAVGVSKAPGLRGSSVVAEALAGFLRDLKRRDVVLVRVGGQRGDRATLPALEDVAQRPSDVIRQQLKLGTGDPARLELGVRASTGVASLVEHANALFTKLADVAGAIVLDLGCPAPALARAALETCDHRVEIVARIPAGERSETTHRVVNRFNDGSETVPISHCAPYVLPADPALSAGAEDGARQLRANPWSPATPPLRRLARKLGGGVIGIALGGGAAFGIANVGVLKVLEENDIYPDLVAGTSFGAIVGVGYAAGIRPTRMLELARKAGTKRTLLSAIDPSLTQPSLLSGDRVMKIFHPMLGPIRDWSQLALPCRVVATDIESGERVTMGSGRLEETTRASWSVPMIWPPQRVDGRPLVDGGVVDPVPADVVREMGGDLCLAVNVVPSLKRGVETFLSRAFRRVNRLNPLAYLGRQRDLPNMFDLVMNSIQTLQYELGNFKAISADVRINPDLSDFTWIEFYRPDALIERGARATESALPEIRAVIEERLGAGN